MYLAHHRRFLVWLLGHTRVLAGLAYVRREKVGIESTPYMQVRPATSLRLTLDSNAMVVLADLARSSIHLLLNEVSRYPTYTEVFRKYQLWVVPDTLQVDPEVLLTLPITNMD